MAPEGWRLSTIEEVAAVSSGGTPSRKEASYWGGDIPWVTTAEVNSKTITSTTQKITEEGLENSSAKLFPARTILMAMYGQGKTRGQVARLGIEASTNQACAAILLNEGSDTDYYYYFLESRYVHIRNMANTGGQENLSAGIVKSIQVPVPPLPEQKKIAQILSTWDQAITATERLFENSQQRKKGLMQQLLTGKKQLPGFDGEWKEGRLSDLCGFRGGSAFKEIHQGVQSGELPFIKVSDMNLAGNEVYIQNANNWVSCGDAKAMRAKAFPKESIVFAKVGAALLLNRRRILVRETIVDNNMMAALPNIETSSEYLYQVLLMIDFAKFVQDGAVPSINQSDISSFKIKHPELEEQKVIARILHTADQETARLQKLLGFIRQEKKALMQQLLTGKRRVQVEAA